MWYFLIVEHPEKSLLQSGVHDGTDLFLWNGEEVKIVVFLHFFFFFLLTGRLRAKPYIRTVLAECCKTENQLLPSNYSRCKQTVNNQNLKQIRVTDTKQGKTSTSDLIYD